MKACLAILFVCLLAAPAAAVLDPDPDIMCANFDSRGNTVCRSWASTVTLYVLYTNPTPAAITGFVCRLDARTVDGAAAAVNWLQPSLAGSAVNFGTANGFVVGYTTPLPTTTATRLATIQCQILEPAGTQIDFYIGDYFGSYGDYGLPTVSLEDGSVMETGLMTDGGPCAQVGGPECSVVETVESSFGALKSLYR